MGISSKIFESDDNAAYHDHHSASQVPLMIDSGDRNVRSMLFSFAELNQTHSALFFCLSISLEMNQVLQAKC